MPVEIVWSPLARARLHEVQAYIALDNPDAVERMTTRIAAVVETLKNHPHLGRAGAEPGMRELVIGETPCVILYRAKGQRVTINTIRHGAQQNER